MTTLLHIASSSNLQGSLTRKIGALALAELQKTYPHAKIIERDLVKNPLPHLSPEFLGAAFSDNPDASPVLSLSNTLIDEVFASDVLVLEAPMYNFGIPSGLKAWIDHIVRKGKTFAYTASGPEGLIKNKKAFLISARGGIYSEGPAKVMDYQETYLRSVLGFIGITDIKTITLEGVAMGPDKVAEALTKATNHVHTLATKAA